jgi:molecular chaperone GrpE
MSDDAPVKTEEIPAPAEEALQKERDELRDRLLRVTAEFDNYRKRTDRERRELSEAVVADLVRELLPAVDDLERALAAPSVTGDEALRTGVDLIHRQILEAFRRRGIAPVDSVGQPFDPNWHEALASDAASGRPDNEITSEVRRGYRIGGRLLRPALVRVAKA